MNLLTHLVIVALQQVYSLFERLEHLVSGRSSVSYVEQVTHTRDLNKGS